MFLFFCFLFLIKIKQICGDLLFVSFQLNVCVREGERVCVFSAAIKQKQKSGGKRKNNLSIHSTGMQT